MVGVLNINKPEGITSHDVVNQVRRLVGVSAEARRQRAKAGHAGTLDPFATGVLLVAVGPATRLLEYISDLPKTYQATFTLGATSDTDDRTGEIVNPASQVNQVNQTTVEEALQAFIGDIQQKPPAYSAVKIKGKKLYEEARAGNPISAPARDVTIHSITVTNFNYPEVSLEITCGSGTYIRSIARDLGEKLSTGGYVKELTRTVIGNFSIDNAIALNELTPENVGEYIQPSETLVSHLPRIDLTDIQETDFRHGKQLAIPDLKNTKYAVYDTDNTLLGIGMYAHNTLSPSKVITI